jgi:hypothetical protein
MSDFSWLPAAVLYTLTSLSDGCLLVAAAIATTLGGRPILWGASFALAHLTYALLGAFAISQLNSSSELVGDALIVVGSLILLSHTLHHQLRHVPGGGCGCSHHTHSASLKTMLSTSFGLSLHSMAGGAIARQFVGDGGGLSLVVMVLVTSLIIGALVGCIVQVGEWERGPLTKFFDKIPGLVSGALIVVAGWCSHHLLEHLTEISTVAQYFYFGTIVVIAAVVGCFVHERTSINSRKPRAFALPQDDSSTDIPSLVKLTSRKA